jgi:5-methylcytosine-specific restriction protein A
MSRREFPRKVRAAVFLRAAGCCEGEGCGAKLKTGEGEVDHILADWLGGEPTIDNARLLCRVCHGTKTADDIRRIRKTERVRDKFTGAWPKSKRPLRSRGFQTARDV